MGHYHDNCLKLWKLWTASHYPKWSFDCNLQFQMFVSSFEDFRPIQIIRVKISETAITAKSSIFALRTSSAALNVWSAVSRVANKKRWLAKLWVDTWVQLGHFQDKTKFLRDRIQEFLWEGETKCQYNRPFCDGEGGRGDPFSVVKWPNKL